MISIDRLRYIRNLLLFTVALLGSAIYIIMPVFMANRALHPQRYPAGEEMPNDLGLVFEKVQFTTADSLLLHGWYFPAQYPKDPTVKPNGAAVIALHAYNGNRTGVIYHAELLAKHGYGVLAIDLRAHGESEGDNFSFGWNAEQDVFTALDFLQIRQEIDPDRIGVLRLSIGAEVALQAAARAGPDRGHHRRQLH